jgi:hypothetical protein
MDQTDIAAPPKLRLTFAVGAAVMLALWGWSLWPAIENWNNPNEDGFSLVPGFWGTICCLPAGLFLLAGAIVSRGRAVSRARKALYVGGAVLLIIVAFLILQWADAKFHLGIG